MNLFQSNKKLFLLSLFLCLFSAQLSAQTNEILNDYKKRFAGHHIVVKNDSKRIEIEMVKGVPQVVEHIHEEYLILDQNGLLALSEESIEFSSFESIKINDAYVMVPTEKGSKKIAVTNIRTRDAETTGSVFHDDNKEMILIFPRMEIGALRVLDYTVTLTENKFPFGNHFSSYYPKTNSVFEISADTSVNILYKEFHMKDANIEFSNTIVKGKRTLKWFTTNPPIFKRDVGAPNRRYYSPHVLAQIANYTYKNEKINVLSDTKDLYKWYFENIREVLNEEPSADIKSISDSITKGIASELEKVEQIYYWVQNNIKYIAFEEGINGFVPRQPSAVMHKRYGDCKDMASIIYSMLKSQGIQSHLTWIGSRDLPYKYSDFPSTTCDNHMINTYKFEGVNYFLDATNPFLAMKEVASFTTGKEALIALDESKFEIVQLPTPNYKFTTMTDTTQIRIDGRKIIGSANLVIDGYYQQMLHYPMSTSPIDKHEETLTKMMAKGNNSFKVTKGKIGNVTNREEPLDLVFDFEVDNYVTSYDKETYLNMILEKDVSFGEMMPDRIAPFEFDQKSSDNYTVVLTLPENQTIKSIPPNKTYNSDIVDFSVTYKQVGDKLFMTLLLDIKTILIEPSKFKEWNDYYKALKNAIGESVVLIDKK